MRTDADRLLEGDRGAAEALARRLLKPRSDNLVERPWGGTRLRAFKGLETHDPRAGRTFGESFELAADDGDDEARRHPSILTLADGSPIALPRSTPQWPSSHSLGRGCGRTAPKRRPPEMGIARRGPASGWNQAIIFTSGGGGVWPGGNGPKGGGSGGRMIGASSAGGSKRSRWSAAY